MPLLFAFAGWPSWIICGMASWRRQCAAAIARALVEGLRHFPSSALRFLSPAEGHRLSEPQHGLPRKCPRPESSGPQGFTALSTAYGRSLTTASTPGQNAIANSTDTEHMVKKLKRCSGRSVRVPVFETASHSGQADGCGLRQLPSGAAARCRHMAEEARFKSGMTLFLFTTQREPQSIPFLTSMADMGDNTCWFVCSTTAHSFIHIHAHTRGHVDSLRASATLTQFTKSQRTKRYSLPGRDASERVRCQDPSQPPDFPRTRVVNSRHSQSIRPPRTPKGERPIEHNRSRSRIEGFGTPIPGIRSGAKPRYVHAIQAP
jgi:hypothetical protein